MIQSRKILMVLSLYFVAITAHSASMGNKKNKGHCCHKQSGGRGLAYVQTEEDKEKDLPAGIHSYVFVGPGWTILGKSQLFEPTPGLTSFYESDKKRHISPIIGFGVNYQIYVNSLCDIALGIEGAYIDYGKQKGTLSPASNLYPQADKLNYSFRVRSALALIHGSLEFKNRAWLPYLSINVGYSYNRLSDYQETAVGQAAPSQHPHLDAHERTPAYSVGAGIYKSNLPNGMEVGVGYKFVYAKATSLKHPITAVPSIESGNMRGHFLVLSLRF